MSRDRSSLRFYSTRGPNTSASFQQALLQGLATDGGLFVPDRIPTISPETWHDEQSFGEMAGRLLSCWLEGEIDRAHIAEIASGALDFDVPLCQLSGRQFDAISVLELFHGPTLSFKDFGARTMGRLMEHFLESTQEQRTVLVATSGDTGSAVADGFAGQSQLRVVLLYPKGGVSPTQELQLAVRRPGTQTLAVDGTFDDCQALVKAAFVSKDFAPFRLTSANSINIGRLIPQTLYYYRAVQAGAGGDVAICVPSGNLGNLTAGVMAARTGLPVTRFIAAHNANAFFARYLQTGAEHRQDTIHTLSNAMDVGVPSNFERLRHLLPIDEMRSRIWATTVSDDETLATMRAVYEETGYVSDPHTAVGIRAVGAYRKETGDHTPVVVLSTAHPGKFPETVRAAIGHTPDDPPQLSTLRRRPTQTRIIRPNKDALMRALAEHA